MIILKKPWCRSKKQRKNPIIQGIHLEGPFISVNYKGAQDASYIKKPDEKALAHWNELSGNRIRVVTYAPEEATEEFENWCLSNRIVPSADIPMQLMTSLWHPEPAM